MNLRNGLFAVVIMALVMSCGGSKDREQQYLEKAKKYVQEENQEKARVELKNVLQINPKNIEAIYLMAQLAEKDRDWPKMYAYLMSAVAEKPDYLDAQVKLGGLFLLSGEIDKASEKVEFVLSKETGNTKAMILKAAIFLRKSEPSQAEDLLQKVLASEPGNLDATYLLTKLYDDTKEYSKALKILEASLVSHPDELNLALMKVQLLVMLNQPSQAEALALGLLKRFPENEALYYSTAKHYVMAHKPDKAERVLQDLIAKKPSAAEPKLAFVNYLISQKNEAKAEQVLLEFVKDNPDNYDLSFALVQLYKNKPEQAIKILNQIIEADRQGPNASRAKIILAAYAESRGDKTQALQLVEQVIADDPHNADALMLHSSLLVDQGHYDAAIADLRTVLRDQPNSEKALMLSARTHLKSGYFDLAQESLENVLTLNPANINVRKDLARMLVRKKEPERAISLLEGDGNAKRKNAEVLAMLVDLHLMNKAWDKAEEAAKSIDSVDMKGLSHYKLAQVYAAQQKYPLALSAYHEVLRLNPLNIESLAGLTDTYLAMGEPGKAGSELDKLLAANPENLDLLNLRGFLYKSQKQFPEAEQVFSRLIKLKKDAESGYRNLGLVFILQNRLDKALSVYQQGLTVMPENINLLLGLAELYEKTSKIDAAIDVYTKVLKIAPNNMVAANNLAAMIANSTEDPKRLKEAYELVKIFKDSKEPALIDTYGWLSFLNGQTDLAIKALERVIEINPDFAEFNYHLGMAYAAKDRNEEAKLALKKALANPAEFPGKAKAIAKLAALGGA